METPGAKWEGWAVVELFGHQREAGFVTTQYFGDKAMFQIDVPEIPEREVKVKRAQYLEVDTQDGGRVTLFCEAGTTVKRAAVPGRSRLVSPGAVYALNPCTEEVVREMHNVEGRAVKVTALPEAKQIAAGEDERPGDPEPPDFDEEDGSDEDE